MKFTKTMKRIFVSLFSALFCVTLALCLSVSSLFTASAAETITTTKNITCAGASVRIANDGKSGIRFHVQVKSNASGQVTLDRTYSKDEFLGLTSGILLIPSNKLSTGEELTLDGATNKYASGAKAANVTGSECVWEFEQSGNTYYYEATAYIYNIPEKSYENNFTFRGYCVGENGTTYYTENTNNTRSVSYVALRAKIDDVDTKETVGATAGYQGDLLAQLNNFLPTKLVNVDKKFVNKDAYLYRVGNGNTVAISSLFDTSLVAGKNVTDFADSMDSYLKVETKAGNASCEISGTDAASATLQFSGTGVVKLTVTNPDVYTRGDNSASTTEMLFEVVNAVNATVATSATSNNVVLLNDVTFSTLSVRNGWTLYGNGFKMTAPNDVRYYQFGCGFVTIGGDKTSSEKYPGGTLDNVQIICPNPSYAVLYNDQVKDSTNQQTYDSNSQHYGNVRSAVLIDTPMDDTVKIVNSYISGGRAAIESASGALQVINSTVEGGAVANIYVGTSSSLLLRDATLIQEPKQATVHDTSKIVMGFSVLAISDNYKAPSVTLEGELTQYAWAHEGYKSYVPKNSSSVVDTVLKQTDYIHSIEYSGVGARDSVNLGIAFINPEGNAVQPNNIVDNRKSNSAIPYGLTNLTVGLYDAYVYSYKNSSGTVASFKTRPTYVPAQSQETVLPTVNFTAMEDGIVCTSGYTNGLGWNMKLTFDLDTLGSFDFYFSDITATKDGRPLSYTVKNRDTGADVDANKFVTFNDTMTKNYVLLISDYAYDAQGNLSSEVVYEYNLTVSSTKTSIAAPEKVAEPGGSALLVVKSKNSDWSCAIPALEGTQIKYYNKTNKAYETLALSSLTPTTTGKQNGTNNYWQYSDANGNYTLKVTCGVIHDTKSIYGMPVVVNNGGNKMYFTISSTNGYVSTSTASRTVTISYEFTDSNGGTLTFSKTWQFNYADYKNGTQYSYSDFVNGNLKTASSGGCITAGTMITLADGTLKAVENVVAGDELLVFNHYTGKYDVSPVVINAHAELSAALYEVTNAQFSNGEILKIVDIHGLYDLTLNEYVMISAQNIDEFIGHEFYYSNGENGQTVTLTGYNNTQEVTTIYSIATADHVNYFANGLLNVPSFPETYATGQVNYFEFDENMMYDEAQMQADIETYGLYTYEDFADCLTEEVFNALPFKYYKIAIGKGLMTWDNLMFLIEVYLAK
ncbi:MAG: hypothetical protein E7371_03120 [Clostridiales bacterium]|nr:hypothetical protein [Clostridiales bacterium]